MHFIFIEVISIILIEMNSIVDSYFERMKPFFLIIYKDMRHRNVGVCLFKNMNIKLEISKFLATIT